jgi:signal transduction histidine kinase
MSAVTEGPEASAVEPGLAEANERLLVRLGFDLHDGPLQQVYALAQDVRLLREQIVALVASEHRDPVVGRFGDLEAQLTELHQDLRDLAHSLEPRSLLQLPLPDAIERELAALSRRTCIST